MINNIKYFEEKKRLLLFGILILILIFLVSIILNKTLAYYRSSKKLNSNIDKAIYLLEDGKMSFNIDSEKIVPSNDSYIYKFSVSNYNSNNHSDVDLSYNISIVTTTNLPLIYKLYRNENYSDTATNLLGNSLSRQDEDGTWYNTFKKVGDYKFNYKEDNTDIYSLVITFPENYKSNLVYADCVDNIEVNINSKQLINGE